MKTIKPTRDNVLIGPFPEARKTDSGIALVSNEAPVRRGMVLAVGPGIAGKKGNLIPMPCKEGDVVIFAKSGMVPVTLEGEKLVLVPSSEIICVLEE